MNLIDLIQPSDSNEAQRPLLHFYRGQQRVRSLSCADIDRESAEFASGLRTMVAQGQPVVLSLPNSPEFIIAFFGILKAGCFPVPITTPDYVSAIYFEEIKKHLDGILESPLWISEAVGTSPAKVKQASMNSLFKARMGTSDDLALVQFSSGSTQAPKGVKLSHAQILANLQQIKSGMRVTSKDVLSSWLPFYHDMGLIGGFLSAIFNHVEAHFSTPADFLASPFQWLRNVAETRTSIIMGPNLLYRQLHQRIGAEKVTQLDLSAVRLALCGAEPVQAETLEKAARHLQPVGFSHRALFPVYGMAENSLAISFPPCGRGLLTELNGSSRMVSCGQPLEGIQVRIINPETNRAVKNNECGEIQILSPSMTSGYYRNPEATSELFDGMWLKTGDIGFWSAGEIFITGRKKEVMIFGGKKFFPQDLEVQISKLDAKNLGRSLVFQSAGGEEYFAAVETKEWRPWKRRELKRKIQATLGQFVWSPPKQVFLLAPCGLPRTSSGKLKRLSLQEKVNFLQLEAQDANFLQQLIFSQAKKYKNVVSYLWNRRRTNGPAIEDSPALTGLESIVANTFARILQIPLADVDFEKSFFAYQMESLHVVQLNTELMKLGVEISLHDFIQLKNLQDLCQYLNAKGAKLADTDATYVEKPQISVAL